ncbi:uncharacterized protein LOC100371263 [Saccoglossus kowalevskii]|uniref:Spindle pole body component 110-like n=1 Tax=Saccoglossus kowalevskii TaxID=10224 RepID=A0ABM0MAW3_SACKO|nr:PREDICTED: spindle pole body component 110-like [Saccoglossus kowalevskii]
MSSHGSTTGPWTNRRRNSKRVKSPSSREYEVMAQLKSTQEDLKNAKEELEQEKANRQELQSKHSELQVKHEAVVKSNEKHGRILERIKNDNEKKGRQIETLQREQTYNQLRIKNLELRVSEVEKTEMQLEQLREVLKGSQTNVRDKEMEIRTLKQSLEDTNKQLSNARESIAELNTRISDLNEQVRDEVKRNQLLETELEVVPILEKELDETKETLALSKKHLQERKAQLSLARQTIKDQRNKIQSLEAEVSTIPDLEEELRMAHYEILTLKKLLIGKDSLVVQKTQELENIKDQMNGDVWSKYIATYPIGAHLKINHIDSSPSSSTYNSDGNNYNKGVQQNGMVESSSPTHHRVHKYPINKQLDVSRPPYTNSTNIEQRQRLESSTSGDRGTEPPKQEQLSNSPKRRVKTAIVKPQMANQKDWESPSNETRNRRPHTSLGFHRRSPSPSSIRNGGKPGHVHLPPGSVVLEEDWMRAHYLHVGDRITFKQEDKYSKNKDKDAEKPPLTGVVRFVGKVDRGYVDHKIYVGLRLDEPIGDTDGVILGKRYFNVMPRHGKLVKISEIISVLNLKSTFYKSMKQCLREERIETGRTKVQTGTTSDTRQLIRVH